MFCYLIEHQGALRGNRLISSDKIMEVSGICSFHEDNRRQGVSIDVEYDP